MYPFVLATSFFFAKKEYIDILAANKSHPEVGEVLERASACGRATTPLGRGRAFLALVILEDKLQLLQDIMDIKFLKEYYDEKSYFVTEENILSFFALLGPLSTVTFQSIIIY